MGLPTPLEQVQGTVDAFKLLSRMMEKKCDHVIGKYIEAWECTTEFNMSEVDTLIKDDILGDLLKEVSDKYYQYKKHRNCYKCGELIQWQQIEKLLK